MILRSSLGACLTIVGLAGSSTIASAQAPSFHPLGDLPGGTFSSAAWGISADGELVAGGSASNSGSQAFVWNPQGGMVGLGDLAGSPFHSHVRGMSADGSVLVGYGNYSSSSSAEGVRWISGVPVGLGFPDRMTNSFAVDVSADGSRVVVHSNVGMEEAHAFLWTEAGGFVELPFLSNGTSTGSRLFPSDISDDGSTIVGYGDLEGVNQAFRWTSKRGTESLGDFPGGATNSGAGGVSADGNVVVGVGYTAAGRQAFRWTEGTGLVSLGTMPGALDGGDALATNADGTVIAGMAGVPGGGIAQLAFIWDSHHGMRDLKTVLTNLGVQIPTGWVLKAAMDVSTDGRTIAGWGTNAQGQFEAYRARLNRPGDVTADGQINVNDLLEVIEQWGQCPAAPTFCAADTAPRPFGDGVVNIDDLLAVIAGWTG